MEEHIRGCRDWKHLAMQQAMYAFASKSNQPYGTGYWREFQCLLLFCNLLPKLSAEQRDDQVTLIRLVSKGYGAKVLAYAEYPMCGRLEGSTYACVVQATLPQAFRISREFEKMMQHVS